MHCLLASSLWLLMLLSHYMITVGALNFYSIERDIAQFNITCYLDKCEDNRSDDSLSIRPCECGAHCNVHDTCCLDSIYAGFDQPDVKAACRLTINDNGFYFLVDHCPFDSIWADLCNNDWNSDDDVQKLVPVFSLKKSVTYKNYYCFRCYESDEDYLYWILNIDSDFTQYETSETATEQSYKDISLKFDKDWERWMAVYDEKVGDFPVYLSLTIPQEAKAPTCEPNVISDCSPEWSDKEMRNKCLSYMSLKEVNRNGQSLKYRNIHCALCNFEKLKDISCRRIQPGGFGGKKPFSFTYLLDINRSDGEFVGKKQKCPDDHVWDRYAKICRKLTCALPGFSIKNGKCVQ